MANTMTLLQDEKRPPIDLDKFIEQVREVEPVGALCFLVKPGGGYKQLAECLSLQDVEVLVRNLNELLPFIKAQIKEAEALCDKKVN